MHPKKERTFVIIKPDGIQRSLVGEIITRLEKVGLKFVGMKLFVPTADQCMEHYKKDDAWFIEKGQRILESRKESGLSIEKDALGYGKEIVDRLVKFMTSGPVIALVLEGNKAVGVVRKLVGGTEPLTSDVGTIRGDLTLDSYDISSIDGRAVRNLIHCSDKTEEAEREIKIWFEDKELIDYKFAHDEILYDVDLNGILE
jgi:nucleoside-diphosphate kinase